ncbi:MAG: hypothetical protein GY839_00935 [candidate division Zixibacteria bacterium]|nr:hypothetical protein [candidate division Zixibacteria bacterium]
MRKISVLTLVFLAAGALLANESNQTIYKSNYDDLKNSTVLYSSNYSTAINFQLGGVNLAEAQIDRAGYIKPEPLAANPAVFGRIGEEGMPDLPLYSDFVIIPDQAGVRINIISADYETIFDVEVMPTQPMEVEGKDDPIPFTKNSDAYSRNEFYPANIVEVSEPSIFKDFRVVQSIVHPFQYNPATKELRVYSDINYELVYDGFDNRNIKTRTNNYISEAFLPLYTEYLANAEDVLLDYEPQRGGYLIVSAYACTTKAKELAEWKHRKGYDVRIISTSDLSSNTSVYVKNAIQNAYDTSDPKIEYVTLIGDEDGSSYKVATNTYAGDVSDHNYSMLEGSDDEPDVIVGRMSVRDINHLNTIMAKTLSYEKSPYMGEPDYWKRGLAVAGPYGSTSPRFMATWVRQTLLDHGYVTVDTVISNTSDSYYTNRITSLISDGVSLTTYRGWGGSSGWSYPSWHTDNIGSLSNGWKIGIMASIVCGTGNFGSTECFNECWIRAGSETYPKGGVGAFGPTDYWTHTAWNNTILMGLTSALIEHDTYHLGAVLIAGKLNGRRSFPHVPGDHGWTWYYHIYNCLGDPELSIRTDIPKDMTVTYNSSIPVGTNFLDVQVDGDDYSPLSNAYVCLVKDGGIGEEVFTGGWTDESGNITFEISTTTADDMHVTVSHRNYIPHQGICTVGSQAIMVSPFGTLIDDDNSGNSSGNDNGEVNPTETVELETQLKNYGTSTTATNVNATLTSTNPAATIIVGALPYPDIPADGAAMPSSGKFAVELDGDIPDDEVIELPLAVTTDQGTYYSKLFLHVESMRFAQTGESYPSGGANLDPGETCTMVIDIDNIGDLNGSGLTGVLSSDDQYISVPDNTASFGTINIGNSGSNSADPFTVSADAAAYDGRNVVFELELTSSGGVEATTTFDVVLGDVGSEDAIGPDNYGYYMYENNDIGYDDVKPTYDWVEISSIGTPVSFTDADDASSVVGLPFRLVYYGNSYSHIIVSTNGFISPDTAQIWNGHYHHNWDNYPIPDPGCAQGQISPFWDDMKLSSGNIYTYSDVSNNLFIIEWNNVRHAITNALEKFQVIIYDPTFYPTPTGDAEIVFQYHTITNNDNNSSDPDMPAAYSSIGFENWDEDDGIQYEWNNEYHPAAATIASGRAVKITTSIGGAVLQVPSLVSPPNGDISDDTTPTLTWSEVSEATVYHLQVDDNSDFSSPVYDNDALTGESYSFAGPISTGQYYWRVRCGNGEDWSGYSPAWNFIVSILETPVAVSPGDGGTVFDSEPVFIWTTAPGAIRYQIQIDDSPSFTSPIFNNSNVTDTSYQVSSPISPGTYYWHIRAFDGYIWSDYSAAWDFSTSVPNSPQLTSPPNGNEDDTDPPTFIWEVPEGASAYTLVIDDNNDFSSPILDLGGLSNNTFTPVGSFDEGTYYWHVSAEGDFGESAFSTTFTFIINYGVVSIEYLPGDVNMANGSWPPMVIGGDVTYLVNYFRAMPTSPACLLEGFWCSADANGDCLVIGSDVTKLVSFFRGLTTITFCADYEPAWPTPDDLPPDAPPGWPNCETGIVTSKVVPDDSVK